MSHPLTRERAEYVNRAERVALLAAEWLPRASRAAPQADAVMRAFFRISVSTTSVVTLPTSETATLVLPTQRTVELSFLAAVLSYSPALVRESLRYMQDVGFVFFTSDAVVFDFPRACAAAERSAERIASESAEETTRSARYGCVITGCVFDYVDGDFFALHKGLCPVHAASVSKAAMLVPCGQGVGAEARDQAVRELRDHAAIMRATLRDQPHLLARMDVVIREPQERPRPVRAATRVLTPRNRAQREAWALEVAARSAAVAEETKIKEDMVPALEAIGENDDSLVHEGDAYVLSVLRDLRESVKHKAREDAERERANKVFLASFDRSDGPWMFVGMPVRLVHVVDLTHADCQAMTRDQYATYMRWYDAHPEYHGTDE